MLVRKAMSSVADADPYEFILSDATVDRYGDVIEPAGWKLAWFKKNPIALFNHDSDFPIGVWENIRVEAGALRAKLVLAVEGTSARIDEIRRLVEQKILRASSVGFRPLKGEPMGNGTGGFRYTEQELLETSVVSVPANPNALAVAKSLKTSDETLRLVFGKNAIEPDDRAFSGQERPDAPPETRSAQGTHAMTLAERIAAAQARLVALQDQQRSHIASMSEVPTDEQNTTLANLTGQIEQTQRSLDGFKAAERAMGGAAAGAAGGTEGEGGQGQGAQPGANIERRGAFSGGAPASGGANGGAAGASGGAAGNGNFTSPTFAPVSKLAPADHVFRSLAVLVKNHGEAKGTSRLDTLKVLYGENDASAQTKAVMDVVFRAASTPADTVTPSWAGVLVQQVIGDFYDALLPQSVYPGLSARGIRVALGRAGSISLPSRNRTPTVAGSFVGEGAPIPVRQAAFGSVALGRKKLGVITTMTREIMEASTPAIETILRDAIQEDTALSLDTVLLDAGAATSVRPAGLRQGVTVTAATDGADEYASLVGDIKALTGALITATSGNVRAPVWLMNPLQAMNIGLTQNAAGDFPFAAEMGRGVLRNIPVIESATVPAGMLVLVDAADFFTVTGDEPRFDLSDQATLHMEDTTPTALSTAGTPNVVAAPVRSMFQTDTLALRMIMDVNWAFRRTGNVAWTENVNW